MSKKEIILAGKYKLGSKIGQGAFGDIYSGIVISSKRPIAIKLESIDAKKPQLAAEYKVYQALGDLVGFPEVYHYGNEGDYNVLVMDYLGKSLHDLLVQCDGKFSLKTTLMLADQLLCRLEIMHAHNYIHRDIKPENFVIGREGSSRLVFVIDLGLANVFREGKTHIRFQDNRSLVGSVRFMAISTHLGHEQSRRSDIESLAYTLIFFMLGRLPWQGIEVKSKEKYEKVREMKQGITIKALCKGLPIEFEIFLEYVRAVAFSARIDYAYLRRLFRDLFYKEGFIYDAVFDWDLR